MYKRFQTHNPGTVAGRDKAPRIAPTSQYALVVPIRPRMMFPDAPRQRRDAPTSAGRKIFLLSTTCRKRRAVQ
eukprot:4121470-Pyramimonas_sp.AAC.1